MSKLMTLDSIFHVLCKYNEHWDQVFVEKSDESVDGFWKYIVIRARKGDQWAMVKVTEITLIEAKDPEAVILAVGQRLAKALGAKGLNNPYILQIISGRGRNRQGGTN